MKIFPSMLIIFLVAAAHAQSQRTLNELRNHPKFLWRVDSLAPNAAIYYQDESWTSQRIERVRQRIAAQIDSTKTFIGTAGYNHRVHLFVVSSREEMKNLIGYETDGTAFYTQHAVTGIAGVKTHSIYSNHEFFHLISMNVWGLSDTWLNEGMAVYSDKKWQGHPLHELTKYLVEYGRYIPLKGLMRKLRKFDSMVSYPLLGSFAMYLDTTYGREVILRLWRGESLKRATGKSRSQLRRNGWV